MKKKYFMTDPDLYDNKIRCFLPDVLLRAHSRSKVRPIKKLMQAAVVAEKRTTRAPGTIPNKYPLEAVRGMTGIASISASI